MDLPSREALVRLLAGARSDAGEDRHRIAPWYPRPIRRQADGAPEHIEHILSTIPYKKVPRKKIKLPTRSSKGRVRRREDDRTPPVGAPSATEVRR